MLFYLRFLSFFMIVLLIFLSQFDVQNKGKALVVSIEPLAMPSNGDIAETPNVTKMLKRKFLKINLEIMKILDEANMESKEMMKILLDLRVQSHHYEVSSNESLVI